MSNVVCIMCNKTHDKDAYTYRHIDGVHYCNTHADYCNLCGATVYIANMVLHDGMRYCSNYCAALDAHKKNDQKAG